MTKSLMGLGVALATPLKRDYSIDFNGLERLIDHVIEGGADYLVVMGTTGESPVFSWQEKLKILEKVQTYAPSHLPIVFGHGGNDTFGLIDQSKDLKQFDLSAVLSVCPYYSRPSQDGIVRHFQFLADEFPSPIILYNVPSRTGSNMESMTSLKLARHGNICGIKEASGDIKQIKELVDSKPDEFLLLSGDDGLTLEIIRMGAQGVISVIGNAFPSAFKEVIVQAANQDPSVDFTNQKLAAIYDLLGEEGNPTSLKTALEVLGICGRTVKPPLFDGTAELYEKWRNLIA